MWGFRFWSLLNSLEFVGLGFQFEDLKLRDVVQDVRDC